MQQQPRVSAESVLIGEPFKTVAKNSVLVNAKSRELNLGFFRVNTVFLAVCGATSPLAFVSVLPGQCTGKLVSGSLPRQDNGNSRTLSVNNDAPVNRIRRSESNRRRELVSARESGEIG